MLSLKSTKKQIFTTITRNEKKQGFLSVPTSPLLAYSKNHVLTLAQSFEGIQIFGGTGSGKTSGSANHIAKSLLHGGFGGLVLCAKEDEADNWIRLAKQTGRTDSIIRFSESSEHYFNFIAYELARGATPFEVAEIIDNARNCLNPQSGSATGDGKVWEDSARNLLVAALVILYASTGTCELRQLKMLINQAPQSAAQISDEKWRETSLFSQHIKAAQENVEAGYNVTPQDFTNASDYFAYQYTGLAERTRSSIVMNLMAILNRFDYGLLANKFTHKTTVVPEVTHGGAIILVDLPAMRSEDARMAAHIWKYAFQRATTRQANEKTRPVFLFADECQYFFSDKDVTFQSTARSSRVATVYATQSLDAYRHALGGTEKAATATRAFLANLRTQIFHANNSEETNNYAATLIGKTLQWRRNRSNSKNRSEGTNEGWSNGVNSSFSDSVSTSRGSSWSGDNYGGSYNKSTSQSNSGGTNSSRSGGTSSQFGEGVSEGASEQKDFRLDPDMFLHGLRNGGEANDYKVDAVIVSPEILLPYLPATFDQKGN